MYTKSALITNICPEAVCRSPRLVLPCTPKQLDRRRSPGTITLRPHPPPCPRALMPLSAIPHRGPFWTALAAGRRTTPEREVPGPSVRSACRPVATCRPEVLCAGGSTSSCRAGGDIEPRCEGTSMHAGGFESGRWPRPCWAAGVLVLCTLVPAASWAEDGPADR